MRRFDRIMLSQRFCSSRTVRRLEVEERWVLVACLCLAGQSPVRGQLLVTDDEPLTPEDIADEAGVEERVAKSAIDKLVRFGTLERRGDLIAFPNWSEYNPAPKPSETRPAWRERKAKQRRRERKARAAEPEIPTPPKGNRKRDRERYREQLRAFAIHHFNNAPRAKAIEAIDQAVHYGGEQGTKSGGFTTADIVAYVLDHFPEVAA